MSEKSGEINELAKALSAAQGEFMAIPKDAMNPFFKKRYVSLSAVIETASPVLSRHGLSVSQWIGWDGNVDTLTTYLLHSSGQYIANTMHLYLVKNDPQGQGSSTTYARRYSYMAVLGLVADDDDDGNKASKALASHPESNRSLGQKLAAKVSGVDAETGEIRYSPLQLELKRQLELLTPDQQTGYKSFKEAHAFPSLSGLSKEQVNEALDWIGLLGETADKYTQ